MQIPSLPQFFINHFGSLPAYDHNLYVTRFTGSRYTSQSFHSNEPFLRLKSIIRDTLMMIKTKDTSVFVLCTTDTVIRILGIFHSALVILSRPHPWSTRRRSSIPLCMNGYDHHHSHFLTFLTTSVLGLMVLKPRLLRGRPIQQRCAALSW